MPADPPSPEPVSQPSVLATGVCGGVAVVCIVLGLLVAGYMLLVMLDILLDAFFDGHHDFHVPFVLTGWAFVAACIYAAWRLFTHPSYRCLWSAMPAVILYAVFHGFLNSSSVQHMLR